MKIRILCRRYHAFITVSGTVASIVDVCVAIRDETPWIFDACVEFDTAAQDAQSTTWSCASFFANHDFFTRTLQKWNRIVSSVYYPLTIL
jgi:hypothetical protein